MYKSTYGLNQLMQVNLDHKILYSHREIKLAIAKKRVINYCIITIIMIAALLLYGLALKYAMTISLLTLFALVIIECMAFILVYAIKWHIFKDAGLKVPFKPTVYIVYENDHDKTEVDVDVEHLQKMNHYKFLPIEKYNIKIIKMPKTIWFVYMAKNYFICYTRKGELLTVLPTSDFWDFKETHKVLHLATTAVNLPRPKSVI